MNTRRLTKKYKYKNRNKKTRRNRKSRRSGRRILKGGVRQSVIPSVTGPSVRPSAAPLRHSASLSFKKSYTDTLIDSFFRNLKKSKFPEALCELYKLYNSLTYSDINKIISSESFKEEFQKTFYIQTKTKNQDGVTSCNFSANTNYIYFLSYIFKKLAEGHFIYCNGKRQYFFYSKHKEHEKDKIPILTVLKRFLGYLDTACVTTMSYTITKERYEEISQGQAQGILDGEYAMYDIVSSLQRLVTMFPSLEYILEAMTLNNRDGTIASYNMNTTVLSTLIRQSYTDFLDTILEKIDEP